MVSGAVTADFKNIVVIPLLIVMFLNNTDLSQIAGSLSS